MSSSFSASAAPRYVPPTGSKPTDTTNVQEGETIESDEPPIVDLAAQKAKEELAYQEWRDGAPMRHARHLQQTMKCPVYYLAKDGMMYKADESPRKRRAVVEASYLREKRWRLAERKVHGPTDDGLCKGEWEYRDVWVLE